MENIQKVSPDNSVSTNTIYNMDCIEGMKMIPDGSIDCIITDPPYGTTACKRDTVIPFDVMREQLKRIIKPNGAIVLFGSQPFTSALVMSNIKMFKTELLWIKEQGTNQFLAKYYPLKQHENILIFCKTTPVYNPQFEDVKIKKSLRDKNGGEDKITGTKLKPTEYNNNGKKYPTSLIKVNRELQNRLHPTQKPVALLEYLIKTYTNEGETVLDFTMGSGTTAIACINTNRNFIGFELDENYWNIANKRIQDRLSER